MTGPSRQLTFDLPCEPSFARDDFLPAAENAEALAMVEAWPRWPSASMLLVGPPGAGKSHLGAIWARAARARVVVGATLSRVSPPELAEAPALLIDDADRVGEGEAALFHLLNLARERELTILLTARSAPGLWGLATPDLASRLRLAPIVALGEPSQSLLEALLLKLFTDRQLRVEPALVAYVAARIERSFDAARAIVAALDREALARGQKITRALAAEFLRDAEEDSS